MIIVIKQNKIDICICINYNSLDNILIELLTEYEKTYLLSIFFNYFYHG